MQPPTSLALLGAVCSLGAAAAGRLPRGVGPEFAAHYEGRDEFACITAPSVTVSLARVNDKTCDCPDGSDEPGTAACAHIDRLSPEQPLPGSPSGTTNASRALPGFWCANDGHVGAYLPFAYVDDGVCDYDVCCDGSDEHPAAGCQNRCADIGREHRRLADEKRKKHERAQAKRNAMVKEAAELRLRAEERLVQLTSEVQLLEAKKAELEKKLADVEREDKGRVVGGSAGGGKLGVLLDMAKRRVKELRETLDSVVQERDELRARAGELETMLRNLKDQYNPNFNDEGVKAAVKAFDDYAARGQAGAQDRVADSDVDEVRREDGQGSGISWAEFEDAADDTDILYSFEAYLPESLRSLVNAKIRALRVWLIENGMLADRRKPGTESHRVKAAREAVEEAERTLQDKQRALDTERSDADKDYGPSGIFRALKGKSISIEAGEYTYELSWLETTWQKSKKGHGNTNMGNFARIDRAAAADEDRLDGKSLGTGERMVLRYEGGQACWNGPQRRTDVWLGCAERDEVWRVSEAEKCVYKMEVGTPAACEGAGEAERGKDEL